MLTSGSRSVIVVGAWNILLLVTLLDETFNLLLELETILRVVFFDLMIFTTPVGLASHNVILGGR